MFIVSGFCRNHQTSLQFEFSPVLGFLGLKMSSQLLKPVDPLVFHQRLEAFDQKVGLRRVGEDLVDRDSTIL